MKLQTITLLLAAALLLSACTATPEGSSASPPASEPDSQSQSQPQVMMPPKMEYQQGSLTESRYESVFYGLEFALPEGMTLASSEEYDVLQKQGVEAAGAAGELVDRAEFAVSYEFMAVSPKTQANLVAVTEKLSSNQITPEQYLEASKVLIETQMHNVDAAFDGEVTPLELAGHTFAKLRYKATLDKLGSLWQETYVTILDNRALVITLSYMDTPEATADAQTLLAGLTVLIPGEPSSSSESSGESSAGSSGESSAASQ